MPVKDANGRALVEPDEMYHLPFDEAEWDRLNMQHKMIVMAIGGMLPCSEELVEAILAPDGEEPKRVLDAGCGTGIWGLEMAASFPHVQVLGIDMAPLPPSPSPHPPNFSFSITNINDGLSHLHNQFDLIHARCIGGGVSDYSKTLKDFELCLKPGGLLVVMEGDRIFQKDRKRYIKMATLDEPDSTNEENSWLARFVWEGSIASVIVGKGKNSGMILDSGPWDLQLCDPDMGMAGSAWFSVGPWAEAATTEETEMLKQAGTVTRNIYFSITKAMYTNLMRYGMDQRTIEEWSKKAEEELSLMKPETWTRLILFWTRRRAGPGLSAPPIPALKSKAGERTSTRYPAFELYRTREEALAKCKEWHESIPDLSTFAVAKAWKRMQEGQT